MSDRAVDPVTVFLVDGHELVRRGVRDLSDDEPDLTVVGEAGTTEQALARVPAARPDVAILDMRLPDGDGVSVCRELRSRMSEPACPMPTSFDDEEALFDSITAGAAGHVLEQINGTDLVSAVCTVARGGPCSPLAPRRGCCPGCAATPPRRPWTSPSSPTANRRSSRWSARG